MYRVPGTVSPVEHLVLTPLGLTSVNFGYQAKAAQIPHSVQSQSMIGPGNPLHDKTLSKGENAIEVQTRRL